MIDFLERYGARNITIVAFDSSAFPILLDAYKCVQTLGYLRYGDRRRWLENHSGEYLAWGGYHPDTYKLLLVISLDEVRTWTQDGWEGEISDQVHMHTGLLKDERVQSLPSVMS